MATLKYMKPEPVSLQTQSEFTEKWLLEKIVEVKALGSANFAAEQEAGS